MSKLQLTRMAANVGFDSVVGAVPLLGDAFDFFFKSNTRNLRILKKHLDKHHPGTMTVEGQAATKSSPISAAGADWVKRPTEM